MLPHIILMNYVNININGINTTTILYFYFLLFLSVNIYSYPINGSWIKDVHPSICYENHLCLPSGETYSVPFIKSMEDACDLLLLRGITEIHLFGDSYMRHILEALIITLTGNYKDSATEPRHDSKGKNRCEYNNQFSDKYCRDVYDKMQVCNNNIMIYYISDSIIKSRHFSNFQCKRGRIVLLSYGNHPIIDDYNNRPGVNDPEIYQKVFKGICDNWNIKLKNNQYHCNMFWVSTHARTTGKPDESFEKVKNYNLKMREFFESGKCTTKTNYIDVYNMTGYLYIELLLRLLLLLFCLYITIIAYICNDILFAYFYLLV